MPLQIHFEARGTDSGTLHVRGLTAAGAEVLVAVQRRADGQYLTPQGRWAPDPSWFPCPRRDSDDALALVGTGTALTAGIRGARAGLRVHLRRRDYADAGDLEVPDASPHHSSGETPSSPGGPQRPPGVPPISRTPAPKPAAPTRRMALILPLAGIALAVLVWWSWVREGDRPGPAANPAAALATLAKPAADAPTGKALYLAIKGRQLPPADLFATAEAIARTGDCEAALRLFVEAAKGDPQLAERLGARFDPAGFAPAPCIPTPQPDSALVWYLHAAEAGRVRAQGRYGELLLGEARSGPVREDAIHWLRKAAAGGDRAAAERLRTLGEPQQ